MRQVSPTSISQRAVFHQRRATLRSIRHGLGRRRRSHASNLLEERRGPTLDGRVADAPFAAALGGGWCGACEGQGSRDDQCEPLHLVRFLDSWATTPETGPMRLPRRDAGSAAPVPAQNRSQSGAVALADTGWPLLSRPALLRARQDLNLRPLAPEASALSTELRAPGGQGYISSSSLPRVSGTSAARPVMPAGRARP
jgi:hypothetical protein